MENELKDTLTQRASECLLLVLDLFKDQEKWQGKTGGYLYVHKEGDKEPLLVMLVGTINPEKTDRYRTLCQEKAERLHLIRVHVSSWQSRKPDIDQWGGAIKLASGYVISFSGLPELGDEAFCMYLAYMLELAPIEELQAIASISDNLYWLQIEMAYIVPRSTPETTES